MCMRLFIYLIFFSVDFQILYAGIKCFTRCDGFANEPKSYDGDITSNESLNVPTLKLVDGLYSYRIQNQALPFFSPFIKNNVVVLSDVNDFDLLLRHEYISIASLSVDVQMKLLPFQQGCHILRFFHNSPLFEFPLWKGKTTVNLLVNKFEKISIIERWNWILSKSKNELTTVNSL